MQTLNIFKLDTQLVFDANRLCSEFHHFTATIPRRASQPQRYCVNYSEMDVDDEMSLIAFTSGKSPALEELKQTILGDYEYQYDDPASIAFLQTWTPENLLKVYHGTYTADVVKQVAEWVRARGGILGPIQYFEIPPCYCYIYHHDKPSFFNLHIPIQTQVGNFFIAENELGTMLDAGHLYALNTTGYHTALNSSKQTRIHLVFTVLNNSL